MAMLLKEVAVTADRPLQPDEASVENMSRVVCALLIQGLQKKITPPEFWKISIDINSRDTSEDGKILLGVLVVNRGFPVAEFTRWTRERRQSFMLEFVSTTVREVLRERNLNASPVDDAIRYIVERDFQNVIVGKKRFSSPNGKEVAHVECVQEMDEARIYVVLKGRDVPLRRVLVATTVPEEFIFQAFFCRIEWHDSHPSLRRVDGTLIPIPQVTGAE